MSFFFLLFSLFFFFFSFFLKKNLLLDEENFILDDEVGEKSHGMKLKESMKKASEKKLLEGYSIFVTENVKHARETIQEIVVCAGGKVFFFFLSFL